ncbi:MAG: hypothetical protein M3N93_02480 [Acidobacteriota bacterium]|nr:hypothetical protein [Acidobacteriota bacterium]
MYRSVFFAIFAFMASGTICAASTEGWKVRVDRSNSATDPDASGSIKFVASGPGFHASNPQAAVYWNSANVASGSYTLKGTFTLLEPSNHTNYYGLIFGGKDLDGAQQSYAYFTVAQDGTWLIKRRDGSSTSNVAPKTHSDAVKTPGPDGKCVNALEVRVMPARVDFVVNGAVVHSEPKSGALASTDGIYGMRVNHFLDVQIDGVAVSK